MKNVYTSAAVLGITCLLFAASKPETNENAGCKKETIRFILHNKKASMPVVIRGNIQSKKVILFLHGGPGGTALKKIGTKTFEKLEVDFGVIYWEQRGADKSRGGTQKEFMTLEQFIDDLDLLVDLLRIQYPKATFFLMGHCWGGALATAYLADSNRQAKIGGCILLGAAYNNPRGDSLSMVWVKQHARQMIEGNQNVRYWKNALEWYDKNPSFTTTDLNHYSFVRKANGYQLAHGDTLGIFPGYTLGDIFKKPNEYLNYYINYYKTLSLFDISKIDLSSKLPEITVPTLIIWGSEDGLVPIALGYEAYELLGTVSENKKLVVLENTAHTVFYEQPTAFSSNVRIFVDQHSSSDISLTSNE